MASANTTSIPLQAVLQKYSKGPDSGIFTDGSARPNPGPGGWGVVWVEKGNIIKQLYGAHPDTTNNRMELTAIKNALELIGTEDEIEIFTDSELCCNTMNKWALGWEKKGWKKSGGEIKNLDLVKEVYYLYRARPKSKIKWIAAHSAWLWNEYADSLSTAWCRDQL
jgi:ribonuclease HI